ncbi:MAG: hypothetical protein QXS41_00260 [Candidatus Woesearchaeota archaeon]
MENKCIICHQPAKYKVKGTANFYCEDCAIELFGDLSYLIPISEDDSTESWNEEIDSLENMDDLDE